MRSWLLASFVGLLSSCGLIELLVFLIAITPGPPEAVNFNTDPRILRGEWVMKLTKPDQTVVPDVNLNFSATYNDQTKYKFTSSATIESVPYNLTGVFNGHQEQTFVRTQTSAIRPAFAEGKLETPDGLTERSFVIRGYNKYVSDSHSFSGQIYKKTIVPESNEPLEILYTFQLVRR